MRIIRSVRLVDKYQVSPSKEPDEEGKYVLFHITKTLRGCNYQRVFKGNYRQCYKEKRRLEEKGKSYVGTY